MYSLAVLVVTAISTQFIHQKKAGTMEKGKIAELVIYKVKAEKMHDRVLLVDHVNSIISQFDGFVSRVVHQSHDDPAVYMDYVTWESLEQSKAASEKALTMESLAPFMDAIEEIQTFAHYEIK